MMYHHSIAVAAMLTLWLTTNSTAAPPELPNAADIGQTQEGFRLRASVVKTTFKPHEPIIITVTARNTTAAPRIFHDAELPGSTQLWTHRNVQLTVKDSKGQVMPLTAYGKWVWTRSILPRGVTRTLGPGQETTYRLPLDRLIDMSMPGTYTVTAQRHYFSQDKKRWPLVVSNVVRVKVTE